jgi:hypothetical protein
MGMGINGFISKNVYKNYYIKEKKILGAIWDLPAK